MIYTVTGIPCLTLRFGSARDAAQYIADNTDSRVDEYGVADGLFDDTFAEIARLREGETVSLFEFDVTYQQKKISDFIIDEIDFPFADFDTECSIYAIRMNSIEDFKTIEALCSKEYAEWYTRYEPDSYPCTALLYMKHCSFWEITYDSFADLIARLAEAATTLARIGCKYC